MRRFCLHTAAPMPSNGCSSWSYPRCRMRGQAPAPLKNCENLLQPGSTDTSGWLPLVQARSRRRRTQTTSTKTIWASQRHRPPWGGQRRTALEVASRYQFAWPTFLQTTEVVCEALERAWRLFGTMIRSSVGSCTRRTGPRSAPRPRGADARWLLSVQG
jgi:hypothetical protein